MPPGFEVVEAVLPHLPEYRDACFPDDRMASYVLNPAAKEGKGHSVLFQRVLAVEASDAGWLRDRLVEGLSESPAILHKESTYGQEWEVPARVTGRNGRDAFVITAWLRETTGEGTTFTVPRFVTARVAPPEEIPRLRAIREFYGYSVGTVGAPFPPSGAPKGIPPVAGRHRRQHPARL